MKKIITLFLILGANIEPGFTQNMVNDAGYLVVGSGANLVLEGDFANINNGTVTLDGTFTITGDVLVQTGATMTWNSGSSIEVNGGGTQNISGVSTLLDLTVENNTQAVLGQDIEVTGTLTLTSGKVQLGNNTLTLGNSATVSGASSTNYILTNGTGALKRQVSTSGVTFPIGTSSGYNPVTLTNTGTADNLSVRVADEILEDGTSGSAYTSRVVDRTWFITEDVAGSLNMNAAFQWASGDELTSFDRVNAVVYHYTGGAWTADGTSGTASGSDPYSITVSGITTLSTFGVGEDSFFPVEWLSFDAQVRGQDVMLDWATSRESNSDYFAVERASDLYPWANLSTIPAAGFAEDVNLYQYTDREVPVGTHYYRLRQVDLDGAYSYSKQLEVELERPEYSFYPNPVRDYLTVELKGGEARKVLLYDLLGRKVLEQSLKSGLNQVDFSNLGAGTYEMRLVQENGSIVNEFLIKN